MKKYSMILALVTIFCLGNVLTSSAVPTSGAGTGANISGADWTQPGFGCFGCPNTDTIEYFIVNDGGAGPFMPSALTADIYTPAGWTGQTINPYYALATGPTASGAVGFDVNFAGSITSTLTLDDLVWLGGVGGTLVAAGEFVYDNGSWGNTAFQCTSLPCSSLFDNGTNYNRTPSVPEPSSFLLLGSGLAGLWLWGRRRFRIAI